VFEVYPINKEENNINQTEMQRWFNGTERLERMANKRLILTKDQTNECRNGGVKKEE
jgi:hypothetical protein